MQIVTILTSNSLLNICFLSWFSAQVIKMMLDFYMNKSLNLERLTGSGGMPSSHTALVVSLAVGVARIEGYGSTEFVIAMVLAAIVMYDAMGVRREAGRHAKLLNQMAFDIKDIFSSLKTQIILDFSDGEESAVEQDPHRVLKEFLGHTPLEVLAGCLLGILVAVGYPL